VRDVGFEERWIMSDGLLVEVGGEEREKSWGGNLRANLGEDGTRFKRG
jgi:hypothetical protein